jgi:catechol 2,3-dioxygenase-like lactoylglutathione lyase family enzyme
MPTIVLDPVQLAMPKDGEDRARAFYGGVLGLEEVSSPAPVRAGGGLRFRSGSVEVHLGVEPDFRTARRAHPALPVDDLDALAARCEAAGVEVLWDERHPGVRRFDVHDPFGNRIELQQSGR